MYYLHKYFTKNLFYNIKLLLQDQEESSKVLVLSCVITPSLCDVIPTDCRSDTLKLAGH